VINECGCLDEHSPFHREGSRNLGARICALQRASRAYWPVCDSPDTRRSALPARGLGDLRRRKNVPEVDRHPVRSGCSVVPWTRDGPEQRPSRTALLAAPRLLLLTRWLWPGSCLSPPQLEPTSAPRLCRAPQQKIVSARGAWRSRRGWNPASPTSPPALKLRREWSDGGAPTPRTTLFQKRPVEVVEVLCPQAFQLDRPQGRLDDPFDGPLMLTDGVGKARRSHIVQPAVESCPTVPPELLVDCFSTSETGLAMALCASRRLPLKFREIVLPLPNSSRPVKTLSRHFPLPVPPHAVRVPRMQGSPEVVVQKGC
jgi:hypothetical protein